MIYDYVNMPLEAFRPSCGHMSLYKSGGGGTPPPPDPNVQKSETQLGDLSNNEYQTFMSEIYPQLLQEAQQQAGVSGQVTQADLGAQQQQQALTNSYDQQIQQVQQPLQNSIVNQAEAYNTPGNYQQLAQTAMGNVDSAYAGQRTALQQQQNAAGISPTSGAAMSNSQALGVSQAAADAQAATQAYQNAQSLGWQRQLDAANVMSGTPSAQLSSAALGANTGAAAVSAGQTPINNSLANSSALGSATGTAMQGYSGQGSLALGATNAANSAYFQQQALNNQANAGIGSLVGTLGGSFLGNNGLFGKNNNNNSSGSGGLGGALGSLTSIFGGGGSGATSGGFDQIVGALGMA